MFWDYCHFVDDAWWHYYHNENYAVWQQGADRLVAAMRKRMAAGQLPEQLKAAMRQREAAQRERDAVAAAEAVAHRERETAAAEAAFADSEWGGLEMFDLDNFMLDV